MSRFEIKMPKLGESITEGTIVSWSVKVGESVQEDDVLFEVNTAKVSAEIPSPVAGKVMEILCKEGDTVAVGTVVAVINLDGDSASEQETSNESNSSQETTKEKSHNEVPKPGVAVEERWYSPVVIQLARDAKIPKEELDTLVYSVDVLGPPEPVSSPGELDVKKYGVIVTKGRKRGLLLPDLEGVDTVEEQIAIARRKAGIGEEDTVTLERFEVIRHGEKG